MNIVCNRNRFSFQDKFYHPGEQPTYSLGRIDKLDLQRAYLRSPVYGSADVRTSSAGPLTFCPISSLSFHPLYRSLFVFFLCQSVSGLSLVSSLLTLSNAHVLQPHQHCRRFTLLPSTSTWHRQPLLGSDRLKLLHQVRLMFVFVNIVLIIICHCRQEDYRDVSRMN